MSLKGDADDPKGLIYEAFRIEGITKADCRTIFLDWALSLDVARDAREALARLLARYAPGHPDHPMIAVLTEGQATAHQAGRRGGARGRKRPVS